MIENLNKSTKLETALYLVPTPIGNLEDITFRALRVLSNVDIIACEDTRNTSMLLRQYSISDYKLESYHEHNEKQKARYLIDKIEQGLSVALVSDAGSPIISDPGYNIVKEAVKNKIKIVPLPGASAFIPALMASGLSTNNFTFLGFPPQKKGRKTFINKLVNCSNTIILYESPYRIIKLLKELTEVFGNNKHICIARELTKIYEEITTDTIEECINIYNKKEKIKGEFVIIIDSNPKN